VLGAPGPYQPQSGGSLIGLVHSSGVCSALAAGLALQVGLGAGTPAAHPARAEGSPDGEGK
jgi:hypothetical protein